jgi:hypothetical protein
MGGLQISSQAATRTQFPSGRKSRRSAAIDGLYRGNAVTIKTDGAASTGVPLLESRDRSTKTAGKLNPIRLVRLAGRELIEIPAASVFVRLI